MPTSISQLQGPLNLAESLHTGLDQFDIVQDPAGRASEKVLRSLYPAHSYSRSAHRHASFRANPLPKEAFSGPTSRYIRLEYHMMFQPGFDWVKGGKLGGLFSGISRGCNAGCSGGGSAENCFSTRMMWRNGGSGELYLYAAKSVYFPNEPKESCMGNLDKRSPEALFQLEKRRINEVRIPEDGKDNDDLHDTKLEKRGNNLCLRGMRVKISPGAVNHCNPAYGISIGRGGSFKFQSGKWHNITQVVRVNSKGDSVRDGYLAVYLDRELVIEVQDLVLLKNGHDPTNQDQVKFMFSSFFGGHTADYATPVAQWIAWKDFKMSTSIINIWK